MIHNQWSDTKPEFTEECILITACKIKLPLSHHWQYDLFEVIQINGEDGWYWGLCEPAGEQWGALEEFKADKYYTMPLLK